MDNAYTHTKQSRRVLPVLIIALVLTCLITFPFAFNLTYSLPGSQADRTLTYTSGSLTWDSAAEINPDGSIKLSLFKADYGNVSSSNGDALVAPATANTQNIRLLNTANNPIEYTAVLYRTDDSGVPIQARLVDENATDTTTYTLPQGLSDENVVQAISGITAANTVDMVGIDWDWAYDAQGSNGVEGAGSSAGSGTGENALVQTAADSAGDSTADGAGATNANAAASSELASDEVDTILGNFGEFTTVEYGVYLTVSDTTYVPPDSGGGDNDNNNNDANASDNSAAGGSSSSSSSSSNIIAPKTGDNIPLLIVFIIALVALITLIVLLIINRYYKRKSANGAHSMVARTDANSTHSAGTPSAAGANELNATNAKNDASASQTSTSPKGASKK